MSSRAADKNDIRSPDNRLTGRVSRSEKTVDAFYERLAVRAATIDELLSGDFEPSAGAQVDAERAARRLAAWCRASASGDWSLFARRLERDGLETEQVRSKLAVARRKAAASAPAWIGDAIWVEAALRSPAGNLNATATPDTTEPCAFEHLFMPLVEKAEAVMQSDIEADALGALHESTRACLRFSLLKKLSGFCAPPIYERFAEARTAGAAPPDAAKSPQNMGTSHYDRFIAEMKAGGFRSLFEDKPILLRLIASITRQWIDTTREFILHLDADLATIRRDLLHGTAASRVAKIEADLSDPHHGGRSVHVVTFEDGSRVVYKPKDLRVDDAWYALVERLNKNDPPLRLKAVRAISRNGYGWTEFIEHTGCANPDGCAQFFRRAGAWLALFHCFAATDMHQENWIAAGDHPVPIDLEMILQAAAEEDKAADAEGQAVNAAREIVANSVMMVGLLPGYARSPDNDVFSFGGLTAEWNSKIKIKWNNINSDEMRPVKSTEAANSTPNLPHIDGRYARISDHVDDFIAGFEAYAKFLLRHSRSSKEGHVFNDFAGVPIRKVIRPTKFYDMLLQRLKSHRNMDDSVVWSAQADFVARLADWEKETDLLWPLHRAERLALVSLNVPHFVSPSDGNEISDGAGVSIHTAATSGIDCARARLQAFDEEAIAWQITIIRQNLAAVLKPVSSKPKAAEARRPSCTGAAELPRKEVFAAEANKVAEELSRYAIRRGPGAAWIGLDWLGDSDVFQLACLGPDLYNGASGIAVFLAAHAAVTGSESSHALALAGVSHLRDSLKSRNAARMARAWGVGGASGLGSIVYALTVMSKCLRDEGLIEDARAAADLFTDALIAADKQLDVMAGSAGAILGLLRLYRDTQSGDVLKRAIKCGEHLLDQTRISAQGHRVWSGQGSPPHGLNGMSHGAAGFAYALAALSAASGRQDFAKVASECIAFENASYDPERHNWPDLRDGAKPGWPCQWCHGAPGIGLARIATLRRSTLDSALLKNDIANAVLSTERAWPGAVDTLCCGALGSVEFFCEAGSALGRSKLREEASRRLAAILDASSSSGDYRWNGGDRQFNLGLFRGLAGVGYTSLRQLDETLPNVLIWE
jgi:class II lanthipeptide synthase